MNCSIFYAELVRLQILETKNLPGLSKYLWIPFICVRRTVSVLKAADHSVPLHLSQGVRFTWFGKYSISFRYANINKDVHNIRNFNMEICGSYIMVFSSSHTYVTRWKLRFIVLHIHLQTETCNSWEEISEGTLRITEKHFMYRQPLIWKYWDMQTTKMLFFTCWTRKCYFNRDPELSLSPGNCPCAAAVSEQNTFQQNNQRHFLTTMFLPSLSGWSGQNIRTMNREGYQIKHIILMHGCKQSS